MLPRKYWVTLNGFRTNEEKCKSNFTKWGIVNYAKCDFGALIQTMNHIFNEFPLTKYESGLKNLHEIMLHSKYWTNNLKIQI